MGTNGYDKGGELKINLAEISETSDRGFSDSNFSRRFRQATSNTFQEAAAVALIITKNLVFAVTYGFLKAAKLSNYFRVRQRVRP